MHVYAVCFEGSNKRAECCVISAALVHPAFIHRCYFNPRERAGEPFFFLSPYVPAYLYACFPILALGTQQAFENVVSNVSKDDRTKPVPAVPKTHLLLLGITLSGFGPPACCSD